MRAFGCLLLVVAVHGAQYNEAYQPESQSYVEKCRAKWEEMGCKPQIGGECDPGNDNATGQSYSNYMVDIQPYVEICRKKMNATEDEIKAVVDLQPELFTDDNNAKCVAWCTFEELGEMIGGSFLAVEPEVRADIYTCLYADDPERLAGTDHVVNVCERRGDELHPGDGCGSAYAALQCFWETFD